MITNGIVVLTEDGKIIAEFPGKTLGDISSTPTLQEYAQKAVTMRIDKSTGVIQLIV